MGPILDIPYGLARLEPMLDHHGFESWVPYGSDMGKHYHMGPILDIPYGLARLEPIWAPYRLASLDTVIIDSNIVLLCIQLLFITYTTHKLLDENTPIAYQKKLTM